MISDSYQRCIDACNACADACDHCAASCLKEHDVNAMGRCIALDIDCAAICRAAAGYMARSSEMVSALCRICAEACQACGNECGRHSMEHCRKCAEACQRCATECRRVSQDTAQRAAA